MNYIETGLRNLGSDVKRVVAFDTHFCEKGSVTVKLHLRELLWVRHMYYVLIRGSSYKGLVWFDKTLLFRGRTVEKFPLWVKEERTTTCGVRRDCSTKVIHESGLEWDRGLNELEIVGNWHYLGLIRAHHSSRSHGRFWRNHEATTLA